MYKGVIRYHVRCPKHPRYNPDHGGQGAIVGACPTCLKVLELQQVVHTALLRVRSISSELGQQDGAA